jgi:hypothetical protein
MIGFGAAGWNQLLPDGFVTVHIAARQDAGAD